MKMFSIWLYCTTFFAVCGIVIAFGPCGRRPTVPSDHSDGDIGNIAKQEILRFAQNDKTTFCYRRVLQQQVKRSIAVGYAVWVAKSKTSQ